MTILARNRLPWVLLFLTTDKHAQLAPGRRRHTDGAPPHTFYQSPPAAIARASLGAVLSLDDRFIRLLDAPAGAAYAFDHTTQQLKAVDE
ncbi:hypothetical protein [Janthinobacterium sp. 64]|uniref:hypothetical protein n=1 Tax=Janthinobacterium sp. 64 TaxID=2035208 RepID=UPI000CC759F6|nr:hypothetical protein [Janthinobacterium sp. 64]PKB21836.1 hypothetical protein CLU91_2220 [Janthinobacterium sp. 64]